MKAGLRWPPWTFGSGASVGALASRLVRAHRRSRPGCRSAARCSVLLGSRGLLPVAEFMDAVRADGRVGLFDLPTLLWRFHSDGALVGGTVVGAALSLAALLGWRPRLCFALSTALYLSYATVGRDFLSFQWDNLLLECGLLRRLPTDATRPAPVVHFLFRLVLFKLYFESGVAKWQSHARRLAGRQRDDLLLRDRAAADLAGLLRRTTCPSGGTTSRAAPRWCSSSSFRFVIFGPRRARLCAAFAFSLLPDRQRRHRQLRLLLLPRRGAERLPARRRRRRARRGARCEIPAVRAPPRRRTAVVLPGASRFAVHANKTRPTIAATDGDLGRRAPARRCSCWCRSPTRSTRSPSRDACSRSPRRSSSSIGGFGS